MSTNGSLRIRTFLLGAIGMALTLLLGLADYASGPDVGVFSFYLIPVVICAWYGGRGMGLVVSVLSAATWVWIDALSRNLAAHPLLHVWNTLVASITLGGGAWLVARLRQLLDLQSELARTDPLTGVMNLRSFRESLENEVARCRRYAHPLSVAYVDLDRFKLVNDRHGHAAGDRLLRAAADSMRRHLRETDAIARIGGDEFVILLPETRREAAMEALEKIRHVLRLRPQDGGPAVTLSVGLLTCEADFPSAEDILERADALMYEVKKNGRDGIRHDSI